MSEAQFRDMMLGLGQPPFGGAGGPTNAGPGNGIGPTPDDPMLQMMMQMLGGGGPSGGFPFPPPGGAGAGAGPGANPFASMGMGGMPGFPGFPPQGANGTNTATTTAPAVPNRYASLWRLLHTAVALGLGLYIALWTSFSGTKLERERGRITADAGIPGEDDVKETAKRFFWAFATAEAVLLTTRYFMDRGRASSALGGGNGVLGMVMGFLPQPIKGYIEIGMRYSQIFSTVKADVLVCIFVLGVCSWIRS